ncbi:hypothetical protein BN3590_00942 [Clostridium sp. C105KSO15]|nr:hypothetical protein BN3590_00942 [Clostridium sp. C105KSO15]
MKQKRVSIPILLLAIVCTAMCSIFATQWYFLNQKGIPYKVTINARVVSNEGTKLAIQGIVTNTKGRNGNYIVKYHPGVTIYDSQRNEIAFSDLEPESCITVYYILKIPKYITPQTNIDDYFALEENQEIPNVLAIARLNNDELPKGVDFFDPSIIGSD